MVYCTFYTGGGFVSVRLTLADQTLNLVEQYINVGFLYFVFSLIFFFNEQKKAAYTKRAVEDVSKIY